MRWCDNSNRQEEIKIEKEKWKIEKKSSDDLYFCKMN